MSLTNEVSAKDPNVDKEKRPSSTEGSEGQNGDYVIGVDLTFGSQKKPRRWKCGVRIHTDLYCQYYKEDIIRNDVNCPSYSPIRNVCRTIRASKNNNYQEHKEYLISCSNCHHSINHGLRFRKI